MCEQGVTGDLCSATPRLDKHRDKNSILFSRKRKKRRVDLEHILDDPSNWLYSSGSSHIQVFEYGMCNSNKLRLRPSR